MDIIRSLHKINRWWMTGTVDKPFLYKVVRTEFEQIKARLDDRRILSLIGPRRVGKSTLIYQTISHLLKNNIAPKRILLFSGDEPALFSRNETIDDILDGYAKEILNQNLEEMTKKIYVFIDEIHVIPNWQLYVKSFYDKHYNIKFIISGSSSTHLFKDSKESLLGRIEDIYILPLGIKQFTKFYCDYRENIDIEQLELLTPDFSLYDNIEGYYEIIKENKYELNNFESTMNKIIKHYLLVGGYPEYFDTENILLWQKRLVDDIITRGLYRDIVSIYNIKNPEILEKLMYYIAANSGGEYSYSSVAQTLGVDAVTISSYINYLSQAFFIGVCDNYSPNIGKVIRKNKKIYIADSGIRNAMLKNDVLSPEDQGYEVENSCILSARRYSEPENYTVYFWRDNQKETDIVIDKKLEVLPIEVKYRNTVSAKDLKGFFSFMERFHSKTGIVITKNYLECKDNVYYIPFWLID